MFDYTLDQQTGGIVLFDDPERKTQLDFFESPPRRINQKELKFVYSEEMDILGFDEHFTYEKQSIAPICIAINGDYFHYGDRIANRTGGDWAEDPVISFFGEKKHLEPINIEVMLRKNKEQLESIQTEAVDFLKTTANKYNDLDFLHVAFSGGKDSVAILDLCLKAFPHEKLVVIFANSQMEHPDSPALMDEIRALLKKENVLFKETATSHEVKKLWKELGPPSRMARWCCPIAKSVPQTLELQRIAGKTNYKTLDIIGVRAAESWRRRDRGRIEDGPGRVSSQPEIKPIFNWSSGEVWLHLFKNKLPIHHAYKQGLPRVGCIVCPRTFLKSFDAYIKRKTIKEQVQEYVDIIKESAKVEKDKDLYVTSGNWTSRVSGDILNNVQKKLRMKQNLRSFEVRINTPNQLDEYLKTSPIKFNIKPTDYGLNVEIPESPIPLFRLRHILTCIMVKAAYCIGCGYCSLKCRAGAISFEQNKIKINEDKCNQCMDCLNFKHACIAYNSLKQKGGVYK